MQNCHKQKNDVLTCNNGDYTFEWWIRIFIVNLSPSSVMFSQVQLSQSKSAVSMRLLSCLKFPFIFTLRMPSQI